MRPTFLTEAVYSLDFLFALLTKILNKFCNWIPAQSHPFACAQNRARGRSFVALSSNEPCPPTRRGEFDWVED